jgi:hypothetical protein
MLAMAKCNEASVFVREVQIPGKALLLSSELVKALENQGNWPCDDRKSFEAALGVDPGCVGSAWR